MIVLYQYPLPGVIEIIEQPERLSAPEWATTLLREAVIERLGADSDPLPIVWVEDIRAGRFDDGPLMQAAVAGWLLARGVR